jgi:quercetin dioxygenase-like cupin family protein
MRPAQVSILIICLSVGLVGYSTGHTSGPPTELKLENLLQQPLADEFAPGREVVVSLVEIPPNTTMDRHWHPGEEFHYYLEGEVEIAIDGETSIIGTPGTVGHVPFKKMHTAITGDKGAKILVFRVHTKGKPVRYLEKGGTSER